MSKEESEKLRMNLVAIQKVDPYAKEILDSSPHVAYYNFRDTEWEKTEIEGSFFVYSRVAEPFHSIFINNRLNTNSLVEPIINLELQEQPPFLLYRNQRSSISGFWFYSMEDCVRIHSLVEKLIKKNGNAKPAEVRNNNHHHQVAKQQVPSQQQQQQFANNQNGNEPKQQAGNGNDIDIFSMLRKAQEVSLKGDDAKKPSIGGPPPGVPQMTRNFAAMQVNNPPRHGQQMQQMHHPVLMKQISSTMPDITSPNVVNFFAAAQQPNGVPMNPEQIVQSQGKQFIPNHPNVQPVQTLDEIEKQHRVSASPPQKIVQHHQQPPLHHAMSPQPPMKLQQPAAFQSQASNKPTLITPAMFQASAVEEKVPVQPVAMQSNFRPEPLTQNQLIQALNYMLETDPDFIRKVHEAYIKSFKKIVSQ